MSDKKISIAYSPDTDDSFMILALKEKLIDWEGFDFSFTVGDIQELNDAALNGVYDITAISIGAYPSLREQYLMMPIGASIGDQFGPALVTAPASPLKTPQDFRGKKIAVPGLRTSAHLAAQALIGTFEAVPTYFMDIPNAVLKGDVDGGILIHELQLHPEKAGLKKLGDLGSLWFEAFQLPLPLGANAIKRSLGDEQIRQLSKIYKASIEYGLHHRQETIPKAVRQAAAAKTLNPTIGDQYISMYVNERSLNFQDDVLAGIRKLIHQGVGLQLFADFDLDSHLSPSL